MRRIVVVGASCSGKTTLAQSIAQRLELPHFDMDSIVWGPNWSLPSDEQLLTQVKSIIQHEAWVIDGVFPEHRDLVWARADTSNSVTTMSKPGDGPSSPPDRSCCG
jgi:adenylate kinase family enzyme